MYSLTRDANHYGLLSILKLSHSIKYTTKHTILKYSRKGATSGSNFLEFFGVYELLATTD